MKQILVTPKNVRALVENLGRITLTDKIKAEELSEEEITAIAGLFQRFKVGESVAIGDIRNFHGDLYECLQAHTTQSDWTPDITPALWKHYTAPGVIDTWVQPEGAHDAYALNAVVTHNGKTWRSLVDANVWEPTAVNSTLWEEVV